MNENHVNPMGKYSVLQQDKMVMQMPRWPGASVAVQLAVYGAREKQPKAIGLDCPDGSCIMLDYQVYKDKEVPDVIYERVGKPPILSVIVLDRGIGVKVIKGISTRFRANDGEKYIAELHKHLGAERPLAVIGSIMDEKNSWRRYFWGNV